MINHARTLLLNRQAKYFAGVESAEYIPPTFYPVELTSNLKRIRNILIPQGLDKFGENYLVASIMQLLHSPDTESYVTDLDNRVTYRDSAERLAKMADSPVKLTVVKSTDCDATVKYAVDGSEQPTQLTLAGEHIWEITPTDSNRIMIQHSRGPERIVQITNGTTKSTKVSLLDDYLKAYFILPTTKIVGKFKATYTISLAVPYNIGRQQELLDKFLSRPGAVDELFATVPGYKNQIAELRDIWLHGDEVTMRFNAATLAYIYRCEVLRHV